MQDTQETWIRSQGWEYPLEKEMVTRSTLFAGKSHRQRNLAGYRPWGCRVRLSTYTFAFVEICAKEIMTNKAKMCSVTQSCLPLYDPLDCSPPGSSVHGISQARTLEQVAISFSRGSFQPRSNWCLQCLLYCRWILYPLSHQDQVNH